MATPYLGEIRMVGFNFAPVGWALCDGSTLNISENDALYSLIGTTYGGNGQTTFNLPDLRGRVPIHMGRDQPGNVYVLGQNGGVEAVPLTANQVGAHNHTLMASDNKASQPTVSGNVWAVATETVYTDRPGNAAMNPAAMTLSGQSLPHENMIPFQVVNFIIALQGTYPTQQ
ncbi:MAG TPA: tail fiber protein [Candidatus Acidoferrales bacterium]|nr:tail fiber protein [Candidatus Acidoferrales bacterium]